MVNQQPWIADASHNAMHQPAGPEIVPPATKLPERQCFSFESHKDC